MTRINDICIFTRVNTWPMKRTREMCEEKIHRKQNSNDRISKFRTNIKVVCVCKVNTVCVCEQVQSKI